MQKYTSIILSSRDANEFDRIYFLYTKEAGLVRVIGRGVRKPAAKLTGHLEPGTLSEVYVARSRGMGQITSAITLENFENIKKDFEKLIETLKIFKFFTKSFSEGEKDERIFELLRDFLNLTNKMKNTQNLALGTEAFWWKFFELLGHKPEAIKCTRCQKKLNLNAKKSFSSKSGGVLCDPCAVSDSFPISNNQIKLLRLFLSNPLASLLKVKVSSRDLSGLEKIRKNYQKYYFG